MIIKLNKLYSEPEIFTPIIFKSGVNIILGEKVEESTTIQGKKNNGVGKSVCIEFINFCLLKDFNRGRVALIPKEILPEDLIVHLELEIDNAPIKISRAINRPNDIKIGHKNIVIDFESDDTASKYLNDFIKLSTNNNSLLTPSFRELMGPIIREEKSEFNDIIQCYAPVKGRSLPLNFVPHLFFLGISIETYKDIKQIIRDIEVLTKTISKLKKDLTNDGEIKINDIKATVNALNDEVDRISLQIDALKTTEIFANNQDEIIKMENELDKLKIQRKAVVYELERIKTIPDYEDINEKDIELIYEVFKNGLGDKIAKSLEQVKSFKTKIDDFQQSIIKERYNELRKNLETLNKQIKVYDDLYSQKLKIIDEAGVLKNLKIGLKIYNQKNEDLLSKKQMLTQYEEQDLSKKRLKNSKSNLLIDLDLEIEQNKETILSLEKTILNIHDFIMGNKEASFDVKTTNTKDIIDINLRTFDDHSNSTEKAKVFIYDMSLMFNEITSLNHPHFLVHDNILGVDQDTTVRCLNYIDKICEHENDFQYILTMNRDVLDLKENKELIKLDIDGNKIASFTKNSKFLKRNYQEI